MGRHADLDPWEVEPLHEVRQERAFRELVDSMQEEGWQDRPLLVIECETGYLAWTGSHRIAAAREANLATIPCYVIEEEVLRQLEVSAKDGHFDDRDRLEIIRKIGDEEALDLMWMENRR